MNWEQAEALLQRLARQRFANLVLGGGEPFLWRPGVLRLAAEAKNMGFFVQVGTNGIALPAGFENEPAVDRYVLPLESVDPARHDALRPLPGRSHHAIILGRIEALRAAGRAFTISTLVTAENRGALPEIGKFLAQLVAAGANLHAWHLYKFIPEGRGGRLNAERFAVSDEEYHSAADEVRNQFQGLTVYKRPDMFHSREVDFFWYEEGALQVGSLFWQRQNAL